MSSFRVNHGQKITIDISGGESGRDLATDARSSELRYIGGDDIDDPAYVFRKKLKLTFYDLGTRLRSVPPDTVFDELRVREFLAQDLTAPQPDYLNEYVEIRLEVQGTFTPAVSEGGTLALSIAEWTRLDRALLGSRAPAIETEPEPDPLNPLGFTSANGSDRTLANCLAIYFNYIGSAVHFWMAPSEDEMELVSRPDLGTVVYQYAVNPPAWFDSEALIEEGKYSAREAKPSDASERWNPNNLETGAAQGQLVISPEAFEDKSGGHLMVIDDGTTRVAGSGVFYLVAEPPVFKTMPYHGFHTGDTTNFKVTSQPEFASAEVEYRFKGKEAVYLRPKIRAVRYDVDHSSGSTPHAAWATREFPVYPAPSLIPEGPLDAVIAHRSLYSNYETAPEGSSLAVVSMSGISLRAGSLVAIIQGARTFYVWRKTDALG